MLTHSLPLLEVRSKGEGLIEGYGSTFNGVDSYGDSIAPGAFTKSLADHSAKRTMPVMLWAHSSDRPVGRWESLQEDSRGLKASGRLNIKTQAGADAYEHLRAGDITGLSIGYQVPTGGSEVRNGVKLLKQIHLHEISLVTFPADDSARISSVKAAVERPATLRELEQRLRSMGFSRAEAESIARKGFTAIADEPEPDPTEDLLAVKAAIDSLTTAFKR